MADYSDRLAREAIARGWWAVEDPAHQYRWRPVSVGTEGAVPDCNRLVREDREWARAQRALSAEQPDQRSTP